MSILQVTNFLYLFVLGLSTFFNRSTTLITIPSSCLHHASDLNISPTLSQLSAGVHEQYTRLEFLLFASAVVGIIFYVFQPRVSQRDLDTLSYVGLDKVLRRLLSVSSAAGDGGDAGLESGPSS